MYLFPFAKKVFLSNDRSGQWLNTWKMESHKNLLPKDNALLLTVITVIIIIITAYL